MANIVPIRDQFIVSIGEILWDVIGNQRFVGGAPFNFAYHCQALSASSVLISGVSHDDLGVDLAEQARSLGVDPSGIQRIPSYPTGVVSALTDNGGETSFEIPEECAWDHIKFGDHERELVDRCTLICFGTLAQRFPGSRSSIMAAVSSLPGDAVSLFDLNLRAPFYTEEVLDSSLKSANILKLNEWELEALREIYELSSDDEDAALQLIDNFHLIAVVLTRGAGGASAWNGDESAHVAGYNITVTDTVGCGDAFAAAFATRFISGVHLTDALEAANMTGAFVATQPGATPIYDMETLQSFHRDSYRAARKRSGISHLPSA